MLMTKYGAGRNYSQIEMVPYGFRNARFFA